MIKVISVNKVPVKKQKDLEDEPVTEKKHENSSKPVVPPQKGFNEMGIQMISKNLFQQIFKNFKANTIDPDLIQK